MDTKFNHQIKARNWKNLNSDDVKILESGWFSNSYTKAAYRWFNYIVNRDYPGAKKIKDFSIAGYHWEYQDLIIELR
jgi:hypothetical protein